MPDLKNEMALLRQGYRFIAGVDEAGRGTWAGPVVAAAVILPLDNSSTLAHLDTLNDSKKLTAPVRERLFERIQQEAVAVGVGQISAPQIDTLNILVATRLAMREAITQLVPPPDYLLIDYVQLTALNIPQYAFPKADALSLSVAAASVIAKVTRDRLMVAFDKQYPHYGFGQHKGYGTALHQKALAAHGPCPLHRMSFKPLLPYAKRLF